MSKKKHKKSNPHSAPKPKAKPAPTSKWNQPLVWGIAAIVIASLMTKAPDEEMCRTFDEVVAAVRAR